MAHKIRVEELTDDRVTELDRLFSADEDTDHCWCMWFLIPVKTFHKQGHDGNKAGILARMEADAHPMGLIAGSAPPDHLAAFEQLDQGLVHRIGPLEGR